MPRWILTRHIVIVDSMTFTPPTLTLVPGDCVQWEFKQSGHSVVSDPTQFGDKPFDSGIQVVGATFEHVYKTSGVYPYHCGSMPGMKGVVTVGAP